MQDEEIKARGWSVPIYRAIEAAGGRIKVAVAFGLKTDMAVRLWFQKRRMPAEHIVKLCDMGKRVVRPEQILADIAEAAEGAKVAA